MVVTCAIPNVLTSFCFFSINAFSFAKENTPLTNSKENHVVRHAIHYIQDHLSEPVKVETLAKAQFISREHLTREFKRHTGFSPHAYIQNGNCSMPKSVY